MTRVLVVARIAHDAYAPGESYHVDADRALRLSNAGLIHSTVVSVSTEKESPRGTRKARSRTAVKDDPGSVKGGAGDDSAPGDEQGEGFGAGGYGAAES